MIYVNISAPIQVTKWWNSVNNVNAYIVLYSGDIAQKKLTNRGTGADDLKGRVNTGGG